MVNLLIGVTGSVATIKLKEMIEKIRKEFENRLVKVTAAETFEATEIKSKIEKNNTEIKSLLNIKIVATRHSMYFVETCYPSPNELELPDLERPEIIQDQNEWPNKYFARGDTVLHIEMRKWADLLLIAPLDANTLAKFSNGICDNLLTCILRCWDPKKQILLAPAMNTLMWDHPVTSTQLNIIKSWGFNIAVIDPIVKLLACGDFGAGAMASTDKLAQDTIEAILRIE